MNYIAYLKFDSKKFCDSYAAWLRGCVYQVDVSPLQNGTQDLEELQDEFMEDFSSMLNDEAEDAPEDSPEVVRARCLDLARDALAKNSYWICFEAMNQKLSDMYDDNLSPVVNLISHRLQWHKQGVKMMGQQHIPESQSDRQHHLTQGMTYFYAGLDTGDEDYFSDALAEFRKVLSIENGDYVAWFYLGMIHLYAANHLDFRSSIGEFEKYLHYVRAKAPRHQFIVEALLHQAECYYALGDPLGAYSIIKDNELKSICALLRAAKYLSASGPQNFHIAAQIIEIVKRKNPYALMQVVEDLNLCCNADILDVLVEYCEELSEELNSNLTYCYELLEHMKGSEPFYERLLAKLDDVREAREEEESYCIIWMLRLKELLYETFKEMSVDMGVVAEKEFKVCEAKGTHGRSRYGFKNAFDQVVIKCEYDYAAPFRDGLALVEKGKYGFIDGFGREVVPCIYDSAWRTIKRGLIAVKKDGKWGFVDKKGEEAIPFTWTKARPFNDEGIAPVRLNGYWGGINELGVLKYDYDCFYDVETGKLYLKDSFEYCDESVPAKMRLRSISYKFGEGKETKYRFWMVNEDNELVCTLKWRKFLANGCVMISTDNVHVNKILDGTGRCLAKGEYLFDFQGENSIPKGIIIDELVPLKDKQGQKYVFNTRTNKIVSRG